MKLWAVTHRELKSPIHWRSRQHAAKQAKPTGPMRVRDYHWNDLEAARNNRETVAVIRSYLARQRRMLMAMKAA